MTLWENMKAMHFVFLVNGKHNIISLLPAILMTSFITTMKILKQLNAPILLFMNIMITFTNDMWKKIAIENGLSAKVNY